MRAALSRRRFLAYAGAQASATLGLLGCRTESAAPPSPAAQPEARGVTQLIVAAPTIEGAGVHLRRALGGRALPNLDPFLLLDEMRSDRRKDYERGFPDHPHRGFETVTYMLEGAMEHRDSVGNRGLLGPGTAQWMTAGKGIIHSEMPRQKEGTLFGLQLWVNLPRAKKLVPPRYQDIAAGEIPELSVRGSRVRLVAGRLGGEEGAARDIAVAPTFLDVTPGAGGVFQEELDPQATAFVFVLDGTLRVGEEGTPVSAAELAVLGPGATVRLHAETADARVLVLAARPLGEPIARRGPFVMNTEAELDQAFADYRAGRLTSG
jgi:redox-sensitive bicupin YhaK (pirin superfamily)